tara:strand:- start:6098 stop:6682 length:585 start_codon:yes stop_codon:yes gene_type:complete
MAKIIHDLQAYKDTYDKHKHLKNAAEELGIKWQTLYWHLAKANHPVLGDKERYGSDTDKLAERTETLFQKTVPLAKNNNLSSFQAKMDFIVGTYKVDVKASTKKDGYKNNPKKNAALRWAFSSRVQEDIADFIVCYCYEGLDCLNFGNVEKILLIPKEMFKNKQSISVSCSKSKWYDFEVTSSELSEFFEDINS